MIRSLKVFGVVVAAACAFSAIAASMSPAAVFEATKTPVTLTGKGATKFVTTAGSSTCTTETYVGTQLTSPVTEQTFTPTYGGCTCIGIPCTVDTNGCDFIFRINAANTGGTGGIICPAGQEITLTVGAPTGTVRCTVRTPPQTLAAGIVYKNVGIPGGATEEIEVVFNVANIKTTHTKGTGMGACTSGTDNAATFTGTILVTGEEDPGSGHIGILVT